MAVQFDTPIQYLKGVGPRLGEVFQKREIATVGDLLEWYPRTYEDRRAAREISSLEPGQIVSFVGTVVAVRQIPMGRSHRKMYEVQVADSSGRISCKYFRVPYKGYFERFARHQKVRVSGKVTDYRGRIELHHPDIQPLFENEEDIKDVLVPLYTETEGLSPGKLRKLMAAALDELTRRQMIPDVLPIWMRNEFNLLPREQALRLIHQPDPNHADLYLKFRSEAHRRLIFEEFFWMELNLASVRAGLRREAAPQMQNRMGWVEKVKSSLPFHLTRAQERVFFEIRDDLLKPHPMHRLVQGDVGSGKTMVALLAAAFAVENGYQTALMAPTEILAEQHYKNAKKFLEPLGLKVELITGHLSAKEHTRVSEAVRRGDASICIGTHALLEETVEFQNLGLVIIDEQHRFGVEQRSKLKKNLSPHFLVMTATPIPRTLAMTVYGDLDVSIIDELPPGRSPIVTRKVFPSKRDKVFGFVREQIEKGRQAYIIYPLVEESEKIDLKDAVSEYEELVKMFPHFRVGLLHGRMKAEEKEDIMTRFRNNEIQILVSTTVIEVGVDVPNANIMVIEHAERFGLSQLHQLRGRVGRGSHKSYCILMLSYAVSDDSLKRAEIIESTTDGFKIAEADLEMRGPGEFLGRRQSGLPGFKLANLVRDLEILKEARRAAQKLLEKDPNLKAAEHSALKAKFERTRINLVG